MIFPKPHEYSIGVGRFDIPTHLTVSCNVKEFITAFDFLRLCLSSVYGIDCDLVNADADIEIAKTDVSAESYILEINNSSISIYASDLRGAIYGISSLVQSVIRENSLFIPCAIIKDSPTCQVRGVHFYMPERNKIDEFKRIIDSMALLKMNTVILEVGGAMQYDKHPEINESWVKFCAQIESFPGFNGYKSFQGSDFYWKDSVHTEMAGGYYLTKDEVRDIVTYCKKRGMDVIPEVQGLSHSYYLTIAHPEIAELEDDPFPDTYCPNNEKSYELYFDVAEEVIEVFEPKTVSIGHDEIRVLAWCDKCKGKTGHELVGKEIKRLYDFYKEHGIRIAMWAESAQSFITHKGSPCGTKDVERTDAYGRYYKLPATYKSIDYIPSDVLMLDWYHSIGFKSEECFDNRNFDVIYGNFHGSLFGEWDIRSTRKCIKGAEVSSWCPPTEEIFARDGIFFEMMFSSYILWVDDYCNESYDEVIHSIRESAHYIKAINRSEPSFVDTATGVNGVYFGDPAKAKVKIDLASSDIPDKSLRALIEPLGEVYGVPFNTGNILIKKSFKADSLLFIHNCTLDMKFLPSHYFADENTWGIGSYAVCYDDGTVELCNLFYGRQVGASSIGYTRHRDGEEKGVEIDMDIEEGASPTLPCYYTMDNDWIASLTYNTTPITTDGVTAFAYEWKNPHPDKTIIKIRPYHVKSVTENGIEQVVNLFAVLGL